MTSAPPSSPVVTVLGAVGGAFGAVGLAMPGFGLVGSGIRRRRLLKA